MFGSHKLRVAIFGVALATTVGLASATVAADDAAPPSGSPASPIDELDLTKVEAPATPEEIYSELEFGLFASEPEAWGDAYYDGDTLVINTVTRSVEEAAAVLAKQGIVGGFKLRQVTLSISDYERAKDAVVASDDFKGRLSSVGPDYKQGVLKVTSLSDAKPRVTSDEVAAALRVAGKAWTGLVPPIVVDDGPAYALTSGYNNTSEP